MKKQIGIIDEEQIILCSNEECEHPRGSHKSRKIRENKRIHYYCLIKGCKCKKFEAQDHSQQKHSDKPLSSVLSKSADTYNLRREREKLFTFMRELGIKADLVNQIAMRIGKQDIEFIKRLKEEFDKRTLFVYIPELEKKSSKDIINKLSGEKRSK